MHTDCFNRLIQFFRNIAKLSNSYHILLIDKLLINYLLIYLILCRFTWVFVNLITNMPIQENGYFQLPDKKTEKTKKQYLQHHNLNQVQHCVTLPSLLLIHIYDRYNTYCRKGFVSSQVFPRCLTSLLFNLGPHVIFLGA